MLRGAGLGEVLRGAGALRHMVLRAGRQAACIALPEGVVVERRELDARLVAAAEGSGAVFLSEAVARLLLREAGDARAVQISRAGETHVVRGRVVLACDGLGKSGSGFLGGEKWAVVRVESEGRLGFAATFDGASEAVAAGVLQMCVGAEGYVGLVRVSGDSAMPRVHVGAALLPAACHARRGPLAVVRGILGCTVGCEIPEGIRFTGTGILTRRRDVVGCGRVLAIGDACGYVEPFTGEGIAWAIQGAVAAVEMLPQCAAAIADDVGSRWQERFENEIRPRQRWCRGMRRVVADERLAKMGVAAARVVPWGAREIARRISAG
jgi:flavin-dependent dehydrogenase